jgi:hypothetical protein
MSNFEEEEAAEHFLQYEFSYNIWLTHSSYGVYSTKPLEKYLLIAGVLGSAEAPSSQLSVRT